MHYAHDDEPKIYGVIAEFDDPDDLLKAAKKAYAEGYRDIDAYSPFPIHGLAESIGFHKNAVPLITLVAGLTGAASLFGLQAFGHGYHYPYDIAGRDHVSWPSFIPITFEGMVLCAAFTCGLGMLLLNGLPLPYHPVMNAKNFKRATSDRFFLCIEAKDKKFDVEEARKFLQTMNPTPLEVSEVEE